MTSNQTTREFFDYQKLDPRKELEQTITGHLKNALEKRGFTVTHNGSLTTHAPPGLPDIEVFDDKYHITVEVTKLKKSSSDREMLSISDHLQKTKEKKPQKKCYTIYVSPETHYRMINAVRDHNIAREKETDQKIMPLNFSNFDLLISKLTNSHKDLYKKEQIISLFDRFPDFVDDERVLKVLFEELFPTDESIKKEIEVKEFAKWQELEKDVMKDLERIENKLREYGIAVASEAIKNLIYLIFIKLYEEKKNIEKRGKNWFQPKAFLEFQEAQGEEKSKRAIHSLFEQVKNQKEFQETKLFTKHDLLAEKLDDDFVLEEIIKPLDKYIFYKTKVDGLGAVYEVLAKRSSKDVKVGQFFTPLHIVNFMVQLAELDPSDIILDPACGTGRFLIWAMEDMLDKVTGKNAEEKQDSIQMNQLFGTDNDGNVAKLAKMNMYIHGDGKGNIFDEDGLLLYKKHDMDNKIDVILTNPPLGKLNYRRSTYDDEFYKRMEVIPRKATKDGEFEITGNLLKGGALFVNAYNFYLKDIRDESLPIEWRGGKLLSILDEGILNTDGYKELRGFIKKHFYIKAVVSLTKDAFVPVSNTSSKTSILYAIKKDDPTAEQQEPIFYAHAEKVGVDTKRKICSNHLESILEKYLEFKKNVLSSYDGLHFNKEKFLNKKFEKGIIE